MFIINCMDWKQRITMLSNWYIVLHSYTPMPETEVYPLHLPLGISQGCPVISDEVMRKVDRLLKAEKKPVLLWIYD